jgi:hypothetical protein
MPTVSGPSGVGSSPQSRGQPSINDTCSSPSSSSRRSAKVHTWLRIVTASSGSSKGNTSCNSLTLVPYEDKEAHLVSK